eukprot:2430606-Rhodomonas_salina.1
MLCGGWCWTRGMRTRRRCGMQKITRMCYHFVVYLAWHCGRDLPERADQRMALVMLEMCLYQLVGCMGLLYGCAHACNATLGTNSARGESVGVVFSAVGLLISLCISTPPREKPPSSSARHPTGSAQANRVDRFCDFAAWESRENQRARSDV